MIRQGRPGWPLLLLLFMAMFLVLALIAVNPGHPGDTSHYLFWTWQAVTKGPGWLYAGTYPIDFAIYPPLTFYFWWATGHAYLAVTGPQDFDTFTRDETLAFLLKLTPVAFLAGISVLVAAITSRWGASVRWALAAGILAGITPGVAFDIAVWGQPDSLHTFFLLLGLAALVEAGRGTAGITAAGGWAGVAYALAAASKPQAWALGPVFGVLVLRRLGLRGVLVAGLAAGAVALAVLLPFLAEGRATDLLRLYDEINDAMDAAAANSHNVWWLVTSAIQNQPPFVPDTVPWLAGRSIRTWATAFVIAAVVLGCWRAWRGDNPFFVAAWMTYAFFMTVTRAHENHSFAAVVLLAPLLPFSVAARWLFLFTATGLFVNIWMHDPGTVKWMSPWLDEPARLQITVLASWINLAGFLAWTTLFALGRLRDPFRAGPFRLMTGDSRAASGAAQPGAP